MTLEHTGKFINEGEDGADDHRLEEPYFSLHQTNFGHFLLKAVSHVVHVAFKGLNPAARIGLMFGKGY